MAVRQPASGDILKVRACCSLLGQYSYNVTYWICAVTAGIGATQQEIANLLDAAFNATYKAWLTNLAKWEGVGVQIHFPGIPPIESTCVTSVNNGTDGNLTPPPQICGLIKLPTATGGRRFRGRIFPAFPDLNHCDINTGKLDAGGQALLSAIGALYVGALTMTGAAGTTVIVPGIWHRPGVVPNAADNTLTPITDQIPRVAYSQQKRRSLLRKPDAGPFA